MDSWKLSINIEVCESFGLDFIKALNSENYDEIKTTGSYKSVSISTASAIISYAGIHMAKLSLYVLNNGGKLYYTDTDSIVTNIELPSNIFHPKEIGKLKLEHIIITYDLSVSTPPKVLTRLLLRYIFSFLKVKWEFKAKLS